MSSGPKLNASFLRTNVHKCYQCGACTAGCPLGKYFDKTPNQIVRMIQLGRTKEALESKTAWLCLSCQTCTTRCPQGVDVAGTMDVLRGMAKRDGLSVGPSNLRRFQRIFLDIVRYQGRMYELGLIMLYNTSQFHPMRDAMLGPVMLAKGKLHILPGKRRDLGDLFRRAEAVEKRHVEHETEAKHGH